MAVVATLSKGYDLDYIWRQVDRGPAKDGASYYIHLFLEDTRRAQALLEAAATAHRDHSKPQAIVLGNLASRSSAKATWTKPPGGSTRPSTSSK